MVRNSAGAWAHGGTVSYGDGCARAGSYGIYGNTLTVKAWIESYIGDDGGTPPPADDRLLDRFRALLETEYRSGTPVAAFPVQGPRDVLGDAPVGAMDEDLRAACLRALAADRALCRSHAAARGWDAATDRFLDLLVPLHEKVPA